MPDLYGRHRTRGELAALVGDMSQIAGVRLHRLAEGFEDGTLAADVRTGSGFEFTVVPSRGLDISAASYNGRALAWRSAQTDRHPSHYEPGGLGWLRSFPGGLVTTCGLTWMGAPDVDDGTELGLHGRFSNTPATAVRAHSGWVGDDYVLSVEGEVREAVVFGENVVARRRIEAKTGESRLTIEDEVTNDGFASAPHMLLYHVNIGFPIVDVGSRVVVPACETVPRDAEAERGADRWMEIEAPAPGFREKVYFHTVRPDREGLAQAAVVNPGLDGGLGVYVRYRPDQLPCFVQWKNMAAGPYVIGLEPATALVMGRSKERAAGRLMMIEPGEVKRYSLELGVLAGAEALRLLG